MTMTGGKCDERIHQQRLTEFSPFLRRCCPSVWHCCHLGSEGPHTLGPQTPHPSAISAHPSRQTGHHVAPAPAECTLRRTRAKSALGICTVVSWWEHQRQWCALWCCRCTGNHWPHSVQSLAPLKKKKAIAWNLQVHANEAPLCVVNISMHFCSPETKQLFLFLLLKKSCFQHRKLEKWHGEIFFSLFSSFFLFLFILLLEKKWQKIKSDVQMGCSIHQWLLFLF